MPSYLRHSATTLTNLSDNHEEADTRVWLHDVEFKNALIYSPDIDRFFIGLPLIKEHKITTVVHLDVPGVANRFFWT